MRLIYYYCNNLSLFRSDFDKYLNKSWYCRKISQLFIISMLCTHWDWCDFYSGRQTPTQQADNIMNTIWMSKKCKLCYFDFMMCWIQKSTEVLEQHDKIIRLYVPFPRSPAAYSTKTGWWEKTDTCWWYGQQVASCLTMKQIEKITQLKILLVTNFTQHDSRNKKGYERSTVLCVSKKWDKMKQKC